MADTALLFRGCFPDWGFVLFHVKFTSSPVNRLKCAIRWRLVRPQPCVPTTTLVLNLLIAPEEHPPPTRQLMTPGAPYLIYF